MKKPKIIWAWIVLDRETAFPLPASYGMIKVNFLNDIIYLVDKVGYDPTASNVQNSRSPN